ncbi:MAG: rod shape-determining protein MreC [bacterium]
MIFNAQNVAYHFVFLLILSVGLMIVDHRSELLAPVRATATAITLPAQWLLQAPAMAHDWISARRGRAELRRAYETLARKQLMLEAKLQRYDALQAENQRLSNLLSASRKFEQQALLAEIIEIGLQRFTHRVALNRGVEAGVHLGQPVITSAGVLGQVSALGVNHSVVTLLSHPNHSLPVQIQRNGLRAMVQGLGGVGDIVNVPFLPGQTDIRSGDVLVTSGLGGRFPAGYKVAQVREIAGDPNETFLRITAIPFADARAAREVLLLWREQAQPTTGAAQ